MKINQAILPISILAFSLILMGCQKLSGSLKKLAPTQQIKNATQEELEITRLQRCQKELEALNTVQPQQFSQYKQSFDQLMNGAAQYSGIRSQVNSETQNILDALYRYRVNKLCAQIDLAVLLGLAKRGESMQ
ncbi:hypothetical protein [Yersinia aleksiciae]|uniref:hypothetical protein n=1 Tax=Yersinia aleksiciae TaxID=263819 RepID=UPI0011A22A7C|nr:hypothetical protein [Yersinia aleksiciae]